MDAIRIGIINVVILLCLYLTKTGKSAVKRHPHRHGVSVSVVSYDLTPYIFFLLCTLYNFVRSKIQKCIV